MLCGAEFPEEFFHCLGKGREDQLGSDIGERAKDEKTFRYSGVGQGEARGCDDSILAIEQVDVDDARAVSHRRGSASKGLFDALKFLEGFVWLFPDEKLEDGVEKERGTWGALNGRSFVNLRAEHRIRSGMEKVDSPAGGLEICETRFNV